MPNRVAVPGLSFVCLVALPLALSAQGAAPPRTLSELAQSATQAPPARSTPAAEPARETAGAPGAAAMATPNISHIPRTGRASDTAGKLTLRYLGSANPTYQGFEEVFKEERFLDDVLENLNQSFVLPTDIEVRAGECGEINAFYDSQDRSISICYELLEYYVDMFSREAQTDEDREEAGTKAAAALLFAFYHELGHALINVYELPVLGREEDAADQLATVILLETWETEDSQQALMATAEWFDDSSSVDQDGDEEPAFWDEHSLDAQRYYNVLCWTYGSDPEFFSEVVSDWGLPEQRAERCPSEYQQMTHAWQALIGPHMAS